MKKTILLIIAFSATVCLLAALCSIGASAAVINGDCGIDKSTVSWTLDTDSGVLTIEGSGSIRDYSRTAVSANTSLPWRDYYSYIKTVNIIGVDSLGKNLLANCANLTKLTLPDGLTELPEGLLYGCSSLESFTLPASVANIGDDAFTGCGKLSEIKVADGNTAYRIESGCLIETETSKLIRGTADGFIPSSVKAIADGAFSGCSGLTEVTIPNTVQSAGYGMYAGCTSIESITLPFLGDRRVGADETEERAKYLDSLWYVFGDNGVPSSLRHVTITDTETVGVEAMSGCSGITGLTLPKNLVTIGNGAFAFCTGIENIEIPEGVTTIGTAAFLSCTAITAIALPDSLITLSGSAFASCSSLARASVGKGTTAIGSGAFLNCPNISEIKVSPENSVYRSENNCIIESATKRLIKGCKSSVIPSDILIIGDAAFANCTGLSSVTIPAGVVTIGASAFFGCTGLTTLEIPDSVTSLGNSAFSGCSGLTYIGIPNSIVSFGDSVFANCTSLKSDGMPYSETPADNSGCEGCGGCGSVSLVLLSVILGFSVAVIVKYKH